MPPRRPQNESDSGWRIGVTPGGPPPRDIKTIPSVAHRLATRQEYLAAVREREKKEGHDATTVSLCGFSLLGFA